jgi:hypothetical protein
MVIAVRLSSEATRREALPDCWASRTMRAPPPPPSPPPASADNSTTSHRSTIQGPPPGPGTPLAQWLSDMPVSESVPVSIGTLELASIVGRFIGPARHIPDASANGCKTSIA